MFVGPCYLHTYLCCHCPAVKPWGWLPWEVDTSSDGRVSDGKLSSCKEYDHEPPMQLTKDRAANSKKQPDVTSPSYLDKARLLTAGQTEGPR